jgi:6-phosphofructokinase 1
MMKRIGVLTSGGDAPGMNAAIRAVTRMGIGRGVEVFGVKHGFLGLINGDIDQLGVRSVGGILQLGGTMLGSARSEEFKTEAGKRKAMRELNQMGIEGLVVIGGNGSQTGAYSLHEAGFPVVGVASTIDNDLVGSTITIGVDTAINVALESIDRLKVTASSHERAFLIEVMGRDCGYIALMAGIAGGAEAICLPEYPTTPEEVAEILSAAYERGKTCGIVVIAEGAQYDADEMSAFFKEHDKMVGFNLRTTKLGHVQRGGTPLLFDRLLGTRLGAGAVESLLAGNHGVLVGLREDDVITTPLKKIAGKTKSVDPELIEMARILAQ